MMMNKMRDAGAAMVAALLLAQPGLAATAGSSIPVSASVPSTCTLSSTPLSFGDVSTAGAATVQTDSTSSVSVTCTTGGAYTIALNGGLHASAAQRNVQSGTHLLAYDLYKDSARGTIWTNVSVPVDGTGNSDAQVTTIYGRIAAGLPFYASNGTPYTDTVLVTLTY